MWSLASVGLLILRLVVGLIFVAHGSQKLFGWFGGKGISGHAGFMEMLGARPARPFAFINAAGEFFGGLGVAAGLLTPFAAAGILGSMIVAIVKVHWAKGFWNPDGGIEFPLTLATASFVIGLVGPGVYSLDYAFRLRLPEPWTYIVVLAAMTGVVFYVVTRSPKKQA